MADRRLRELARTWLARRDLDSEVAYVQALLRQGGLPRPRLLLAAYLGSPGAERFLGEQGFPEERNLGAWVRGLASGRLARDAELARIALARAALAAIPLLEPLDTVDAGEARPPADRLTAAAAIEAWLACPCDRHHEDVLCLPRKDSSKLAVEMGGVVTRELQAAARGAAWVTKEVARYLRGVHRKNNQVVRKAVYDGLIAWVLAEDSLSS